MEDKQLLLSQLYNIISDNNISIKHKVDDIYNIRLQLSEVCTNEEKEEITSIIKDKVQKEAEQALSVNNNWGCIGAATGVGKSKIAIDKIISLLKFNSFAKILIVVPTIRLRDKSWIKEFYKWNWNGNTSIITNDVWKDNIDKSCYISIAKIKGKEYDLVILDEGHNLNENNCELFVNNKIKHCIWLSATDPNKDRIKILHNLNLRKIYSITSDEAVKLGIIAPYEITIITTKLDDKVPYIKAGTKTNPFFTTEKSNYQYLTNNRFSNPLGLIKRMQFIYNLKSKTEAAKYILSLIPEHLRVVIFCGSKKQANEVCENRYYSKPISPRKLSEKAKSNQIDKYNKELLQYKTDIEIYNNTVKGKLDLFNSEDINRISCVEALNEGHNIHNPDIGLMNQLSSKSLDFVQRIGRIIRYRPNHVGKIFIICASETEDFNWVRKALKDIDISKVKWLSFDDIKSGKVTITI